HAVLGRHRAPAGASAVGTERAPAWQPRAGRPSALPLQSLCSVVVHPALLALPVENLGDEHAPTPWRAPLAKTRDNTGVSPAGRFRAGCPASAVTKGAPKSHVEHAEDHLHPHR